MNKGRLSVVVCGRLYYNGSVFNWLLQNASKRVKPERTIGYSTYGYTVNYLSPSINILMLRGGGAGKCDGYTLGRRFYQCL